MGECAGAVGGMPRIPLPSGPYGIGDRVFRRRPVEFGVGTGGGEDRLRLLCRCPAHGRCEACGTDRGQAAECDAAGEVFARQPALPQRVVPANAGTHSHRTKLLLKISATVPYREITRYGS